MKFDILNIISLLIGFISLIFAIVTIIARYRKERELIQKMNLVNSETKHKIRNTYSELIALLALLERREASDIDIKEIENIRLKLEAMLMMEASSINLDRISGSFQQQSKKGQTEYLKKILEELMANYKEAETAKVHNKH